MGGREMDRAIANFVLILDASDVAIEHSEPRTLESALREALALLTDAQTREG